MSSRHKARLLAVQAVYLYDEGLPWELEELLQFPWLTDGEREACGEDTLSFAQLLVSGMIEQIEKVDQGIRDHLKNWDFKRLTRVDRSILRLGVYTLAFQREIPKNVVIHESILLAKRLSGERSYSIINGLLDAYAETCRISHDTTEE